jgi:release factor glutamine methyltransferase
MTVEDIFCTARQELHHLYPVQEINAMVRILLHHYTDLTATQIYTEPNSQLSLRGTKQSTVIARNEAINSQLLIDALHQLAAGRPLQYITGETEFCGLTFEVNEQVLIPRPETEELVQWAVEELKACSAPVVLDLCTGSGCIAVAVSKQCPTAKVLACDISTGALAVAQRNAVKNKADVDFFYYDVLGTRNKDIFSQFSTVIARNEAINSQFSILSNPPYVRNSEKAVMRKNVLDYEPHAALFVDDSDPLIFYRAIAAIARQCITADGFVMVEINEALAADTMQLFRDAGFSSVALRQDINGKDRMIIGKIR